MQLDIRDFNLQHIYTLEYIKGICKYLLPMLFNEISVSENSFGQLKIAINNMHITTLFGLRRIAKPYLVQNYSYYCEIPNCYVC